MLDRAHADAITGALLAFGKTIETTELFAAKVPEAGVLVATNAYAFVLACCLDRGMPTEIIWTIPYDLRTALGHLDPFQIAELPLEKLADVFVRLPRKPRYIHDAPRTVKEISQIVVLECRGDASRLWLGKRATTVKRTFMRVHGVGAQISNMVVLLIEAAWPGTFSSEDKAHMDIKADVHTKRVLYRLGVAAHEGEDEAIRAARRLHPGYPAGLDGALWVIGRTWCHNSRPLCGDCPLDKVCPSRCA